MSESKKVLRKQNKKPLKHSDGAGAGSVKRTWERAENFQWPKRNKLSNKTDKVLLHYNPKYKKNFHIKK